MSVNYDVVYIDLDTGSKQYLDRPVNSPTKQFRYLQNDQASVWTIIHNQNINSYVSFFYDSDGNNILPSKYTIENNSSVVEFPVPTSGFAILIFFGNALPSPTPSVSTTPSTTPSSSVSSTPSVSNTPLPSPTPTPTPTPSVQALTASAYLTDDKPLGVCDSYFFFSNLPSNVVNLTIASVTRSWDANNSNGCGVSINSRPTFTDVFTGNNFITNKVDSTYTTTCVNQFNYENPFNSIPIANGTFRSDSTRADITAALTRVSGTATDTGFEWWDFILVDTDTNEQYTATWYYTSCF